MLCLRRGRDLISWNPTIQKSLTLPRSSSGLLATNVAFWFDSLTNDYKVIKSPFTNLSSAEVFSLNNNQWKDVLEIAPEFSIDFSVPPVFNGTLNWIGNHFKSDRRKLAILSFDVNAEVFQTIELPDVLRRYSHFRKLLLYMETSIAVCCRIYDHNFDGYINGTAHPEIWVMKEYGNAESWFNLWTYDESQFPVGGTSCLLYGYSRAIGLLNNGHVLWEAYDSMNPEVHVPNESKMIISTDPETGEYYGLAVFPYTYFSHCSVVTYFGESLVLLDKV